MKQHWEARASRDQAYGGGVELMACTSDCHEWYHTSTARTIQGGPILFGIMTMAHMICR